ncbi:MAG: acylphosphatase [Candidatus Limnocylindria bacterium]
MSVERLTVRVNGHVQGVGFRWWARGHASRMGLLGWVMNAHDEQCVELVAEGSREALDEMEQLMRTGPEGARVVSVEACRSVASGEFDDFGIVRP